MVVKHGGRGPGHLSRWPKAASGASLFDFYVDSVNGDDGNDGTSEAQAFQTLAAAIALAGNNISIGLKRGSTFREECDLSSYTGITLASYGETGNPPVITGFDVQTGWTDDTATVAGRWYKDVAHNSSGTNRQVVIDDGDLMRRVASAAACTTAGDYYSANCSTGSTVRVYINVGGDDPNSNGNVYEVTVRHTAIAAGEDATLTGIVARGAISNNGSIDAGKGANITRCLAAYGTKHNALIASGVATDCVFFDSDLASASESGVIPLVVYASDLRGETFTGTRLMFYNKRTITEFVYSHTLNDPTNRIDTITLDQCVGYLGSDATGGAGAVLSADECIISNSSFSGKLTTPFSCYGPSIIYTRCMGQMQVNATIGGLDTGATVALEQCCITRDNVSGGTFLIQPKNSQTLTVDNCSIDTPASYFGQALGYNSTDTTYTFAVNNSLIEANNALSKHANSTMNASDNNVYVRPSGGGIGPFATWEGTGTNLSTAFSTWRTNSGKDANSKALTATPYTGTTSNGDFSVDSTAEIGGVAQGCTEHWNFNTREIVSTPPTAFPLGPRTYAEGITYIDDPEAWDFYP